LNLKFDVDLDNDYNDLFVDRQERRARKQKTKHSPKKSQAEIVQSLAAPDALEGEGKYQTTYQPSRYEATWLLQSLTGFYRQEYITDVLAMVRGGKEASVYRCAARPGLDVNILAAKVYRPRQFRQLRNDKMYREGRAILREDGKEAKETDHRLMRAIGKKSDFGVQVEHTSWLMYEFNTLKTLYNAGAAVPKPYAVAENAILMGYVGDEEMAGPTLSTVDLERNEASALFAETMRNVELMLVHGMIHGDLSAYNILYWEGKITLIDFPQVSSSHGNSQSHFILKRDIERVCTYFAGKGVKAAQHPDEIMRRLWKRHVEQDAESRAADLSRLEIRRDETEYDD
jgi:RIO kinase 1